jgi:hypothetical protein
VFTWFSTLVVGGGDVGGREVGGGDVGGRDVVPVLGDGLGELTAPVHTVPLSENVVGAGLAPVSEPVNPIDVEVLVAREPFQLALAAVTCVPDCDQLALQPWATFCPLSEKSNTRVQLDIGPPRLVMATAPLKPPGH